MFVCNICFTFSSLDSLSKKGFEQKVVGRKGRYTPLFNKVHALLKNYKLVNICSKKVLYNYPTMGKIVTKLYSIFI